MTTLLTNGAQPAGAQPAGAPRPRPTVEGPWPERLGSLVLLLSVACFAIGFIPPARHYFVRPDNIVNLVFLTTSPNLVYATLLAVLGVGLRRRLRTAWWVFVALLIVDPTARRIDWLVSGEHRVPAALGLVTSVGLAVVAARSYRQIGARAVRGAVRRALAIYLLGTLLVSVVGVLLYSRTAPVEDAGIAVGNIISGDLGTIDEEIRVRVPWWIRLLMGTAGAAVVLGSASALLRAPASTRTLGARDEALVRGMLRDHGQHDSLGYFATRRDKSVVWDDPSAPRAGISYRVVRGVSLASGNPVGDPERWAEAIATWRAEARTNGWSLAVMGAGSAGAMAYEKSGLVAFEIGDEAVLDTSSFSLNAPGLRPVRQAVSRVRRSGYGAAVVRHTSLAAADFQRLAEAASRWRGDGGDERGFSMALGRLGDPLDGESVLVTATDGHGEIRAFLSFVPWGPNGLSLDLMRRDPSAANGIVELMVTALVEQSQRLGVGRVSLNFAMFREAFARGEEIGAGPVARLGRHALLLASRTWQLESLYRSNSKYLPEWQPRFICFEHPADLPRVGVAAGSAEGFLSRPSLRALLRRGASDGVLSHAAAQYAEEVRAALPPAPDRLAEALSRGKVPEQVRVRMRKKAALEAAGIDPYPVGYARTHALSEVVAAHAALAPGAGSGEVVGVTGRVMRKRDLGGLCFLVLRDGSGDLQVMASRDVLGESAHALLRATDLGDHVGVTGEVVRSRSGELSVLASDAALTSKALRPLPDKRLGLVDAEARVRMRYVDLIVRPEARRLAYLRSTVVRSIRDSLHSRGFVEVETPILQLVHGGANARPFSTHINAYDLDLSLRIATELHLKRLVVGGMERVFEVGKQFRNEGADSSHNPEFTSLEVYGTYQDYDSMRVLTQELIQEAAVAVHGAPVARRRQADGTVTEVDLSGDWPAVPICTAVSRALGEEVTPDTPVATLLRHAAAVGLELEAGLGWGAVLEEIYGVTCESATITPVFYTDFPRETSPLTRVHRRDPRLVEKWDLVMWGSEQGTAYSELIDPVDQRARLVEQSLLAAAGNPEAMEVDEDFLQALEYGMPPTGGMGMGVDRLVMNLTGLGIRDTILFPLVRPT